MKCCLLFILLLVCAERSFAQDTDSAKQLKQFYLQKSHHLNSAGAPLVVGGLILPFASLLIALGNNVSERQANAIVAVGFIGGTTATIAGIAMFARAHYYKKKAKALSFGMQPAQTLLPAGRVTVLFQPAITFHLALAKQRRTD